MLGSISTEKPVVQLAGAKKDSLCLFVKGLCDNIRGHSSWDDTAPAITLCRTYDCLEIARLILRSAIPRLPFHAYREAFQLSAQLSDIGIACQLLATQPTAYASGAPILRLGIRPPSQWSKCDAEDVGGAWFWALTKAEKECGEAEHTQEYTKRLAAAFAIYATSAG